MKRNNLNRCRRAKTALAPCQGIEVLEQRLVLAGPDMSGNCPPELDLSPLGEPTVRLGEELTFDLRNLVIDFDANGLHAEGDLIYRLNPDIPTDTPFGAAISADGVVSWTPTAAQLGLHTITVMAIDAGSPRRVDAEVLVVRVVSQNDPPVASDNAYATDEQTSISGNVIADDTGDDVDSDPDQDPLQVVDFQALSNLRAPVLVNTDGSFTYDPAASRLLNAIPAGQTLLDRFFYTISDGHGGTDTAAVLINVRGVNDDPIANDDFATTDANTPVAIEVLRNDFDADGDFGNTAVSGDLDRASVTVVSEPSQGSVAIDAANDLLRFNDDGGPWEEDFASGVRGTVNSNGSISLGVSGQPDRSFTGAHDENGDYVLYVQLGTSVFNANFDPSVFDFRFDGQLQTWRPEFFDLAGLTPGTPFVAWTDNRGGAGVPDTVLGVFGTGQLVYTPAPDFTGADTFTYSITDRSGASSTAMVTVQVNPANNPPRAGGVVYDTIIDTPITIGVLNFFSSDPDGDLLTVVAVTSTENGTAEIVPGKVYTLNDDRNLPGLGNRPVKAGVVADDGTIELAVSGFPDFAFTGTHGESGAYELYVRLGESDFTNFDAAVFDYSYSRNLAVGEAHTFDDIRGLTPGTPFIAWVDDRLGTETPDLSLGIQPRLAQHVTYTPAPGFYTPAPGLTGADSFTYTVSDGRGATATGTFEILVFTEPGVFGQPGGPIFPAPNDITAANPDRTEMCDGRLDETIDEILLEIHGEFTSDH